MKSFLPIFGYIGFLLLLGGTPVALVAWFYHKPKKNVTMFGVNKGMIIPLTVSLFVVVAVLTVITDRLNRGIWTFSQVGWWSVGSLSVLFVGLIAYCLYKEHVDQRKMRGW